MSAIVRIAGGLGAVAVWAIGAVISPSAAQTECLRSHSAGTECTTASATRAEYEPLARPSKKQRKLAKAADRAQPASAEKPSAPEWPATSAPSSQRGGSVYDGFGQGVFLRAGYVVSSSGPGAAANFSGPIVSAGVRSQNWALGPFQLRGEAELVYLRDRDAASFGATTVATTAWTLAPIIAARFSLPLSDKVAPFGSFGIGAARSRVRVSDGVLSVTAADWSFAYTGRGGVEISIGRALSVEAAYRYLNSTSDVGGVTQSAEIGVNYSF